MQTVTIHLDEVMDQWPAVRAFKPHPIGRAPSRALLIETLASGTMRANVLGAKDVT